MSKEKEHDLFRNRRNLDPKSVVDVFRESCKGYKQKKTKKNGVTGHTHRRNQYFNPEHFNEARRLMFDAVREVRERHEVSGTSGLNGGRVYVDTDSIIGQPIDFNSMYPHTINCGTACMEAKVIVYYKEDGENDR